MNRMLSTAIQLGLLASASTISVDAAFAAPVIGAPVVVATTGNVTATFLASSAGDQSQLGLVGGPSIIFDNRTSVIGSTYDLGTFTAGTVLVFSLHNISTGRTYYTGPGTGPVNANPDGIPHASVDVEVTGTIVGFEDTFGGGDRDYNDLRFSFTNTTNTTDVPEPATWAMMVGGFGLVGAGLRRRRTTISFA